MLSTATPGVALVHDLPPLPPPPPPPGEAGEGDRDEREREQAENRDEAETSCVYRPGVLRVTGETSFTGRDRSRPVRWVHLADSRVPQNRHPLGGVIEDVERGTAAVVTAAQGSGWSGRPREMPHGARALRRARVGDRPTRARSPPGVPMPTLEQPLRGRDRHADAAVRGRVAERGRRSASRGCRRRTRRAPSSACRAGCQGPAAPARGRAPTRTSAAGTTTGAVACPRSGTSRAAWGSAPRRSRPGTRRRSASLVEEEAVRVAADDHDRAEVADAHLRLDAQEANRHRVAPALHERGLDRRGEVPRSTRRPATAEANCGRRRRRRRAARRVRAGAAADRAAARTAGSARARPSRAPERSRFPCRERPGDCLVHLAREPEGLGHQAPLDPVRDDRQRPRQRSRSRRRAGSDEKPPSGTP